MHHKRQVCNVSKSGEASKSLTYTKIKPFIYFFTFYHHFAVRERNIKKEEYRMHHKRQACNASKSGKASDVEVRGRGEDTKAWPREHLCLPRPAHHWTRAERHDLGQRKLFFLGYLRHKPKEIVILTAAFFKTLLTYAAFFVKPRFNFNTPVSFLFFIIYYLFTDLFAYY